MSYQEIVFIPEPDTADTLPERTKPYRHSCIHYRFFKNRVMNGTRPSDTRTKKCKLCSQPIESYLAWRHLYRSHKHIYHPEKNFREIF